jgi:hypothetical protein
VSCHDEKASTLLVTVSVLVQCSVYANTGGRKEMNVARCRLVVEVRYDLF